MPDYKTMYHVLFNKITDVIGELQTVQQKTEELYINDDVPIIELYQSENKKEDSDSTTPKK